MKPKHAPGPWTCPAPSKGRKRTVRAFNGAYIVAADVAGEANAKLIAAAPDLLEALQAMVVHHTPCEWVDTSGEQYWHLNKARAAIAKATGH